MADENLQPLKLKQTSFELSAQESSEMEPIDLKAWIENPTQAVLRFTMTVVEGAVLPEGLVCSEDGVLSGTLAAGTAQPLPYNMVIVVQGEGIETLQFELFLTVESTPAAEGEGEIYLKGYTEEELGYNPEQLAEYWKLFADDLNLPNLEDILTRQVRPVEIYHLLSRFATLTVWNADILKPANLGKPLQIKGVSEHFNVYDFEVALVATPKDLFSSERTMKDALQTAQAMVQEAYQRNWNIELTGFDKMVTAAWIETARLNLASEEHKIQVVNYSPSEEDYQILEKSLQPTATS